MNIDAISIGKNPPHEVNVVIEVPIWWGDQDAFGHVNNTVPLRWFESARIAYTGKVGLSDLYDSERIGPILASITVNFRSQLHYPDTAIVGARVARIAPVIRRGLSQR